MRLPVIAEIRLDGPGRGPFQSNFLCSYDRVKKCWVSFLPPSRKYRLFCQKAKNTWFSAAEKQNTFSVNQAPSPKKRNGKKRKEQRQVFIEACFNGNCLNNPNLKLPQFTKNKP